MKQTFRRILATSVCIILTVCFFAGCSSSKKDNKNKVQPTPRPTPENLVTEIRLSGYLYSDRATNLDKFKAVYSQDYPGVEVEIDLDKVSTEQYFEVLDDLMNAENLDAAGDVILLDAPRMAKYAREGKLIDLSKYVGEVLNFDTYRKINPSKDLLPAAYEACLYGNKLYMVAIEYNHKFVLLNYSLIEAAGFSFPKDDWTWDDLVTIAEAVKANGVDKPVAMNYLDYSVWGAFARSNGKEIYDNIGKKDVKDINLTHPDVVAGLEALADIVDPARGLVDCVDSKDIAPEDVSKYAFIIADHEDIANWYEVLTAAEDEDTPEESRWTWDYIHFPRWNDPDYAENGIYYQAIAANVYGFAVVDHGKSEQYNDDFYRACAYLALYATVKDAAKAYADEGQSVPANKEANSEKFWREYPMAGKNSSVFSNFAESADFAGSLSCFMPVMSAGELDISYAIDGYLSGERTMLESLQELQDKAQASWLER